MKRITVSICLIILSLIILFVCSPKKQFSEMENRTLAVMPRFKLEKVMSGEYMQKIENYISDNFPFRNYFMYIRTFGLKLIGMSEINDVYFGKNKYLIDNDRKIENSDDIINTINNFSGKNNINLSVMLLPTKMAIYSEYLPYKKIDDIQKMQINYIYDKLDNNIKKIDIYSTLNNQKNEYDLYYRTDHHWTTYGAYFGYVDYCIANNIDYYDISKFKINVVTDSFRGSTFSKVTDYFAPYDTISIFTYNENDLLVEYPYNDKTSDSLYNMDYLNKKDKYALFLDNNHPLVIINNNSFNDNSSLLVIKDSYANSMIPFLVNHYEKIYVIDPRYYKWNITNYISENNIKDALIIYNVGTLSTDKNITSIR